MITSISLLPCLRSEKKILYLSRSTEITDDARDKFLGVLPTNFFSKNFSKLSTPPGPEVDFEE